MVFNYHDSSWAAPTDNGIGSFCNDGVPVNEQYSYMQAEWEKFAETSMPLKPSVLARANQRYNENYNYQQMSFQESLQLRSRQISSKVIWINLISVVINVSLALVAFYFSFAKDSSAMGAFAADCILDFISSAIVLWRYFGNLSSEFMAAREQIACIYLGALFELSAFGIIIKATSDIVSGSYESNLELTGSPELMYLAAVASLACTALTIFKVALYKVLRDKSILLDVVNTLISTVFALSLIMSQALINVDPSFWCLDPILSIILALFMMAFGIKVLHENFDILKPIYYNHLNSIHTGNHYHHSEIIHQDRSQQDGILDSSFNPLILSNRNTDRRNQSNYGTNLTLSCELTSNGPKTNYDSIPMV